MEKETKATFTYTTFPSFNKKAKERAAKEGTSLSEIINNFIAGYTAKKGNGTRAVEATAAIRILKSHGIVSQDEFERLKVKVLNKYGIFLSPLREENK